MKKLPFLLVASIGSVLMIVFIISSGAINFIDIGANLLGAVGLRSAVPSLGVASSSISNSSTTTSTPTLTDALQQLQGQVQFLTSQIADLHSEIKLNNLRSIFTRSLKRGDVGDDVGELQKLLTRYSNFYHSNIDASSTITGFYGSLTKAAVMQFQSQAGLKETGVFDFGTREKFYESLSEFTPESTSTEFIPIDVSAIFDQNNLDSGSPTSSDLQASIADLQDQVSQLISNSTSTQANIEDLQNQVSQLSSNLANANEEIMSLQNQLSALPSTPTSALAPLPLPHIAVANVQVTNITKSSSTITWTTNVLSTSEVHYSTDASLPASKTSIQILNSMVTNHAMVLQSLNSGTRYYYWVLSRDGTNVTASSTIQYFDTSH